GGSSIVLAQFDLLTGRPTVQRPSLMLGLNGTSFFTAALYLLISSMKPCGSTPSSFFASSSIVPADCLVTRLMRYSSRSIGMLFLSKIWQAKLVGWLRMTRAYLA